MAWVLLVVAGLFVRSLIHLYDVDTGFDKHNVLLFTLDSSTANLPHGPDEIRSAVLEDQIERRVQTIPGVRSEGFAFFTFDQGGWTDLALFQGVPRTPANGENVLKCISTIKTHLQYASVEPNVWVHVRRFEIEIVLEEQLYSRPRNRKVQRVEPFVAYDTWIVNKRSIGR